MIVGVIGRTGSGKSSILQTLFRLVEAETGFIKIDGVDIKNVGLHQIRKHIGYIAQSPFLLQGTIRENIDPFRESTNEQIDQILADIEMKDKIYGFKEGLDTEVSESNNLFSVGEK